MRIWAGVVAAVCAVLLLVGCSSGQSEAGEAAPAPVETPVISGEPAGYNDADVAFATEMVAHHKQALELAAVAREQSTNPQLQALAEQVAAEAQPEINVLNVFLVQWEETPELGEPAVPGDAVERLRSHSGADFDRLWLETMADHHRAAVEIAGTEIATGENVDAVAMARQAVAVQEAGIDRVGQVQKELGS
ncbi:DUF305 domain-containing protein [Mycolicibacterium vaccae]|uniref:DUF305 domain-containing protein n=1 Tax=Mycolicibacterium vaccae TaxID=1810 RepID=UPI003D07C001